MKNKLNLRICLILSILFLLVFKGYAQPAGSNINNPINVGILDNSNSNYSDTKNNGTIYGFGNNYGQASDDIFYKFSINSTTQLNIAHCASDFDTYVHLLDINGNLIASNDDNGPLCAGLQASISISLAAGSYFVVSEGYGNNSGDINTSISAISNNANNFDNYTQFIDYEMRFLDKTGISTGILYDRVNNLASLTDFNTNNPDTSANKHFRQSYFEMKGAAYDSVDWMPMEDLTNLIFSKRALGKFLLVYQTTLLM